MTSHVSIQCSADAPAVVQAICSTTPRVAVHRSSRASPWSRDDPRVSQRATALRVRCAAPGTPATKMLSRTADNLYWLARYVERAEYLARILEVTQRLTTLPLAYVGSSNEWESAVATAGCARAFAAAYPEANEESVTDFLCFSTANPSSIRSCFEIARTNARAVRTALTVEMWDAINGTWLELKRFGNGPTSREEFMRFLRWVQESSLRFDGSAYRTMLRNDAYWFSRLGVYMERADNTARILDVKYHMLLPAHERVGGPLDYFQWSAILRSVSALTAYHWVYRESVKPWLIADLLILRDEMPRSLASCYENLVTLPRPYRARLWPPGAGPAPGARRARPAREQPHGGDLPAGPARIHRRVHRQQQPPGRRHRRAISDVKRKTEDEHRAVRQNRLLAPCVRYARPSALCLRPHAHPHLASDELPLRDPRDERDPDAAADPAQPRRPIRRALADRRLHGLPARPASGRLRQRHACLHRRRPSARARRDGGGRGRDARHPGRRARRGRALSAEPLSARDRAHQSRRGDRRLCRGEPRGAPATACSTCCTSCSSACTTT